MTNNLTSRQKEVLSFISRFIHEQHMAPTVRDIGKHFGIRNNGVVGHLKPLESKGAIEIKRGVSRGISIPGFCPACGRKL